MNKRVYIVGKDKPTSNKVLDKFKKEFRDYILYQNNEEIFVHGAKLQTTSYDNKKDMRGLKNAVYIDANDFIAICYKIKCKKYEELIKAIGESNGKK